MITAIAGIVGKGRKIHAHRNGWAMCGSGKISIARKLTDGDEHRVCQRCAKHLDQAVRAECDEIHNRIIRRWRGYTAAYELRLRVIESINLVLWTPEEIAQRDALMNRVDVAAQAARTPRQVPVPQVETTFYRRPTVTAIDATTRRNLEASYGATTRPNRFAGLNMATRSRRGYIA